MSSGASPDRRFLEEAVVRGVLDEAQAGDCRRVLDTLAEVDVALSAAEIAIRKGYLTKEQADGLKRALARRRVGRYEVLDRLGRGGSGVVWRARDVRLGRVVALKLLARPRAADELVTSYHTRFQREARTAVTLNHVNIVRGLDYGESDGYVYFAMELVPGENAAERLRREGRLAEADALRIALQVVDALLYVREFGLVHRDLKPENLLVTPTGEIKVCDLGLAKPTLEEAARLGPAGTIAGTPLYMAPEQIRDPDGVDWRTDVYGLGATLYHLVTGRPPFLPGTAGSVIQCHLDEPPTDPRAHVLEISTGCASIVLKMLAKDPNDRYASLEDLAADLGAVLDGRPPSYALRLHSGQESAVAGLLADAHGVRAHLQAPRRRRRRLVVAALLLGAAGALAWTLRPDAGAPSGDPGRRLAAREAPSAEAESAATRQASGPIAPAPDRGRGALALARRMERDGASLDELIRQYAHVVETFPDQPSAASAAVRLAELTNEMEGRAADELERRRRAAAEALERDDVSAAYDELVAFPPLYHGTRAYSAALEEATRLRRQGRADAERKLEEARVAAVERRFDDALRLVEAARRTGLPDLPIASVELEIKLEQSAWDAEREERRERWRLVAGRALMTSALDPVAAQRSLDAELASGALRTYAREIEALRGWLPRARRARVRLEEVWVEWATAGRRLQLVTVGPRRREIVGAPVAVRDGRLLLAAPGDAAVVIDAEELPVDVLAEAISPGVDRAAEGVDEIAAFLLAVRRLDDAALFQAPPDLVDVVRAAAVADAAARLDRAAVLVSEGDPVGGRAALDAAIAFTPWYAPAHTALGQLLADLGSLDDAEQAFRVALESARPDPVARVRLAAVLERRSRFADAEAHLRLFLDETEGSHDAAIVALRPQADRDRARVAERRVQGVLETLRRDARNALRAGRKGEAAGLFQQVLVSRPDDPEALLEVGRLHRDAGRIFDAYRAWTRLIGAVPEDRSAHEAQREIAGLERFRSGVPAGREALGAGREAQRVGRTDDAIEAFRRAIRMSPFLVDAHVGLAEALLARGEAADVSDDLTAAVDVANDALLLAPDLAPALLIRSRSRFELGDLEGAVADAERAAGRLPDASAALLLAGRALLRLDRLDEALARLEDAFQAREHPDPLYWQAEVLRRQGRRLAALQKLEQIYERWGAPPHIEVACARLYNDLRQ